MLLYWIFFIVYIAFAFKDIKKAVIAWVPIQLLFNPAEVLWTFSPMLAIQEAINLTLPIIFIAKGGFSNNRKLKLNNEAFLFKTAFVLYILSYGLSILLSDYINNIRTFTVTLKFLVQNFVVLWMVQKCLKTHDDIKFLVRIVSIVTILIVGLAVSEFVLGRNLWQDYVWATSKLPFDEISGRTWYIPPELSRGQRMRYGLARCYSFFNLHLAFGFACAIMLFFVGVLWKRHYMLINKKVLPIIMGLLMCGVLLSNSKGPLIMMLVLCMMIFPPAKLLNIKVLIPLVTMLFVVLVYFPEYILNLVALTDDDIAAEGHGSSLELRQQQLAIALRLFEYNPIFGSGPGSIVILKHTAMGEGILGAESVWIKTLPERGLFGIVVYLSWFFVAFSKLKRDIPLWEIFIILLAIGLVETTNGQRNMLLYGSMLLALRRYYVLRRTPQI